MLQSYLLLIVATVGLALIPGPNVMLILAVSLGRGLAAGIWTVLGTTAGLALQLGFVMLGLSLLITQVAGALMVLKWLGVLYLIYLGFKALRAGEKPGEVRDAALMPAHERRLTFGVGVMVALFNPKTLLFTAAFLPQFVVASASLSIEVQLLLIALCYLLTLLLVDCGWALLARGAVRWFGGRGVPGERALKAGRIAWIEGVFYLIAAGLLALSRR